MLCSPVLALIAAFALPLVSAHGSVSKFEANGQSWEGPLPGTTAGNRAPVRTISTLEPITDPNSDSMMCGPGADATAGTTAEVDAGTDVVFSWRSGGGVNWVHRYGPVMLYAYKCPGDASDCQPPKDAEWFLIDAVDFYHGTETFPSDFTGWTQDVFHFAESVPATIPAGMQNGDYLLRHEIIALHVAMGAGAEYYVSCTQIRVKNGSNTSARDAGAEMVAIPGVYGREDPGIRVNVFGLDPKDYVMPGPKVFAGTGGGSTGGGTAPTKTGSTPKPQPTSPATPSLAQRHVTCKLRSSTKVAQKRKRFLGY